MKAQLSNYRQSPRKVRLVADLVKGKSVKEAMAEIDLLPKRAGAPVKKLILSAISNAKENFKIDADKLVIKELRVDKGIVFKRFMPRAMGRAFGIKKRTSHIHVVLGESEKMKDKSTKKDIKTKEKTGVSKPKTQK